MGPQHTPADEPDLDQPPPPPPTDEGLDYGGDMPYDDPPASAAPQTGAWPAARQQETALLPAAQPAP